MEAPDQDEFDSLRKTDLVLLAKYLNIQIRASMRKLEIQYNIAKHLVELKAFHESALKSYMPESPEIELKRLEIQAQLEMKKLEMEEIGGSLLKVVHTLIFRAF